jgi:spermidine synthase
MLDLRFLLLLVCFFVSGFAALLYQTAWTREFAFLFGTSELAVVAVLGAYMAGLAGGAAIAARFVGRLRRPVLAYGLLELGIAGGALCVPFLIRAVQALYISFAGGLDAPPETMSLTTALFHLAGSFVVLFPCTALMGATLPLLARHAVSEDQQVGPRIGVLYAVNTFGAIAGTLVAAFYLLPAIGLRQTVFVGIAGNAIVFLAAAALARGLAGLPPEEETAVHRGPGFHWILPAMTLSGIVSFIYEVLWTRLLGHVLGGSTAAFAAMLSSFLLGIALGSALAARFASTREAAARGFALVQLGCGILGYIAFRSADYLPDVAHAVGADPSSPAAGAAAAGIVLLPVTLCIGATFPFGVRLLARDAEDAAAVSGRVYAWNTVGSILGAVLAGFFLLPILGLSGTALVGVLTSLVLAALAASLGVPRRIPIAATAAVAILAALVVGVPLPSGLLMHSAMSGQPMSGDLFYLGVGRSATVTVVEERSGWRLLTNGLPESGFDRADLPDERFQETAWLSLLPTAARPDTRDMLLIGLGGAQTLTAVADTVRTIDVIELEEEVVIANKKIPRPDDPFADPRVSLRLGDARGAMNLSEKTYDAIVSQPSHPWTSGASHLYTREFFELVDSKLRPGGIFVQWIGQGFVDAPLFASLSAAMLDAFPYVEVYRPVPAAMVFVASDEPLDLATTAREALARTPESFSPYGIHRVEDIMASLSLDRDGLRNFSAGAPLNTDDHNRLATTRLPRDRISEIRKDFDQEIGRYEPWTKERLERIDGLELLRRMGWIGQTPRALKIAQQLDEGEALTARGWLAVDSRQIARARALFVKALEFAPSNEAARTGLIAAYSPRVFETIERGPDWDERNLVLLDAVERRVARDWTGLASLDEALATIPISEAGGALATRLRAGWRIASGDPERAREAIGLLDELLTRERISENYVQRIEAAVAAGDDALAWGGLFHLTTARRLIPPQGPAPLFALARRIGSEPPAHYAVVRERLAQLSDQRRDR